MVGRAPGVSYRVALGAFGGEKRRATTKMPRRRLGKKWKFPAATRMQTVGTLIGCTCGHCTIAFFCGSWSCLQEQQTIYCLRLQQWSLVLKLASVLARSVSSDGGQSSCSLQERKTSACNFSRHKPNEPLKKGEPSRARFQFCASLTSPR